MRGQVSPPVPAVFRDEQKRPLFMMFAEPDSRSRVFVRDGENDADMLGEACRQPSRRRSNPPLAVRKVFNLVPKFIDSGNVQE